MRDSLPRKTSPRQTEGKRMNEREEAAKWLRLGHETYGPAGARAVARAMGLSIDDIGPAAEKLGSQWMTAAGGDTISADDTEPDLPFHRGPPRSIRRRPPAACATVPPRGVSGWRSYNDTGDPAIFHCGFEGYLEDHAPAADWPVAECFYDERGRLVDESHPYAGCRGTADSYPASDWFGHAVLDPGGILRAGIPAYLESLRHAGDEAIRKRRELLRAKGYPPYGAGPFRAPLPR